MGGGDCFNKLHRRLRYLLCGKILKKESVDYFM